MRVTNGLTISTLMTWLDSVQRSEGDLPLTWGDLYTREETPIGDARIKSDGTRRIVFSSGQPRLRRRQG